MIATRHGLVSDAECRRHLCQNPRTEEGDAGRSILQENVPAMEDPDCEPSKGASIATRLSFLVFQIGNSRRITEAQIGRAGLLRGVHATSQPNAASSTMLSLFSDV